MRPNYVKPFTQYLEHDWCQMLSPEPKDEIWKDLGYRNAEFLHLNVLGPQTSLVPSHISTSAHLSYCWESKAEGSLGTLTQYYTSLSS